MALAKKINLTMENMEEQTIHEQMIRMMALVKVSVNNKALEDACAELEAKIAKLQKENLLLKEAQKAAYDPLNLEIDENELNDEVNH